MGCITLNDINKGCDNKSRGGIKQVVLVEFSGLTTSTIDATGQLTEFTLGLSDEAYNYDTLKDTSSLVSPSVGGTRGVLPYYTPTLTLVFPKNRLELVTEINKLNRADLIAFVQDANDNYWCVGLENGLFSAPSAGFESGVAMGDQNQNTVILMGEENDNPISADISAGSLIDSKILAKFGIV